MLTPLHYSSDRARAALLLPQDLKRHTMKLTSFCNADSMVTRIRINQHYINYGINLYGYHKAGSYRSYYNRLSSYAERERLPLVMGTDSNTYHTAWEHLSSNSRGRDLLQSLSANNLVICTRGHPDQSQQTR